MRMESRSRVQWTSPVCLNSSGKATQRLGGDRFPLRAFSERASDSANGPIVPLRLNDSYAALSPIIVVRIVATWRSSSPVRA